STLTATTVAPGSTPPPLSVTVPTSAVCEASCAKAPEARPRTRVMDAAAERRTLNTLATPIGLPASGSYTSTARPPGRVVSDRPITRDTSVVPQPGHGCRARAAVPEREPAVSVCVQLRGLEARGHFRIHVS